MRRERDRVGMFALTLLTLVTFRCVNADDRPNGIALSPSGVPVDLLADSPLPRIPLPIIGTLSAGIDAETLGVTAEQRKAMNDFLTSHQALRRPWDALRSELTRNNLINHRFQSVIADALYEIELQSQADAQKLLTAEQRAKLRQLKRKDITMMSSLSQRPKLSLGYGTNTIVQSLANDDLLSVLILPDIQNQLMLTDEQWLQIEATQKEAQHETFKLVGTISELLNLSSPPNEMNTSPRVQKRLEQVGADAIGTLTVDQRIKFEKLMQSRQQKLVEQFKGQEIPKAMSDLSIHGRVAVMQIQTVNGVVTCNVLLSNLFSDSDVRLALNLSRDQHLEIRHQLDECQNDVRQMTIEYQSVAATLAKERQDKLRELVLNHNREFQSKLVTLLTEKQTAQILHEKWRHMGLSSLLEPGVRTHLQLTDQQNTTITEVLGTPAPERKTLPLGADFESYKKNMEEWQKAVKDHQAMLVTKVWAQLTPEQCTKYESLTGQKRPAVTPMTPENN